MIRFEGQRLLVPLPAGCWAEAERRKVKIEVVEVARQNEAQSLSFEEFKKVAGKDVTNSCRETVKYKAVLTFDSQMLVDQPKTLGVFVVKPDQEEMQMDVFQPYNDEGIVASSAWTSACVTEIMLVPRWASPVSAVRSVWATRPC